MKRTLFFVLALGLLLRVAHGDWGLDGREVRRALLHAQPAEAELVHTVRGGLHDFRLPAGQFLHGGAAGPCVLGLADALVLLPRSWSTLGGWRALLADLDENPSDLHLLHRVTISLASLLTVLLVHRMVRREAGATAALAAAAILATAYLPVREAHFGTLDTLCALLVVAAVDRALVLAADPRPVRYLQAGICVGLAAATQYGGLWSGLTVIAAHLSARRAARRAGRTPLPGTLRLLASVAGALTAFVALSPDVLAALQWFGAWLQFRAPAGSAHGPAFGALVWHHVRFTFGAGLGEAALPIAVAGGVLAWRAGGPLALLSACTLLLLPLPMLAGSTAVAAGLAPVCLLAALAGIGCERLAARAGPRRELVLAALLALAAGPSLVRSVCFDRVLGRDDTRTEALDYVTHTGASLDDVLAVGFDDAPAPRLHPRPRYIRRDQLEEATADRGWADVAEVAGREYHELLRFDGRIDPDAVTLPDPVAGTPTFLMPFSNPWALYRPGPPVILYERIGG